MSEAIYILGGLLLLTVCAVAYYVILSLQGLKRPNRPTERTWSPNDLTIVIPFRNEAANVAPLCQDLALQKFECKVIWVDDQSEDNGAELITLGTVVTSTGTGKKAALETGVEMATTDRILILDADIRLPEAFLDTVLTYWDQEDVFILPVLGTGNSGWSPLLSLESAGLLGFTIGLAKSGMPMMANGGALAFKTEAFNDWRNDGLGDTYASGDDMFLLQAVKQSGGSVGALSDKGALVTTPCATTLKEAFDQRVRWAGKAAGYRDQSIWWFGLATTLFYLLFWTTLFVAVKPADFGLIGGILLVKTVFDYLLLFLVHRHFGRRLSWHLLPLLTLFYLVYAVVIPVATLVYKPNWKGRAI